MPRATVTIPSVDNRNNSGFNVNDFLTKARECMRDYCLSPDIPDTGIIVAIILYFMAEDRNITMTKLNGYIVLLDMKIEADTREHLFHLDLGSDGLIRNFNSFIEYMLDRELISRRGRYNYRLTDNIKNIEVFPSILSDMYKYLKDVINDCGFMNAKEVQAHLNALQQTTPQQTIPTPHNPKHSNQQYLDALKNAAEAMNAQTQQYNSSLEGTAQSATKNHDGSASMYGDDDSRV